MDKIGAQVHSYNISELEQDKIDNYLVRESIELLEQELDYFFSQKEKLLEFYMLSVRIDEVDPCILQDFFNKCYSSGELEQLVMRIEGQIRKLIERSQACYEVSFFEIQSCLYCKPYQLNGVREEIRTLKLNQAMEKVIDLAWKNTCKALLPKELRKMTGKFRPGQFMLASIGTSPREIRESIKNKLSQRLRAALRQHRNELINLLTREILRQLFSQEKSEKGILAETKTA